MNENSEIYNQVTIGSKVLIVHKSYAFQNKPGGKILPARITSFQNVKGTIEVLFKVVGEKGPELTMKHYIPFTDIKQAILAITSK